jgi:hemerythrin
MSLIPWQDEFNIGVPEVDFEHRCLIDLINRLHAALGTNAGAEAIQEFLGELHAQISAHFALEETIMNRLGYSRLGPHKEQHEALLDGILDILDSHRQGEFVDYQDVLSERLRRWFVDHFSSEDSLLHRELHRRKSKTDLPR